MPETIQLALITFAAGFTGALIGAVSTYIVSKVGVKADRAKLLHDEKKLAYSQVMRAYYGIYGYLVGVTTGFKKFDKNLTADLTDEYYRAYATAILFAPSKVQKALKSAENELLQLVSSKKPKDLAVFTTLSEAMRNDLLAFNHKATHRKEIKLRVKSLFRSKASTNS